MNLIDLISDEEKETIDCFRRLAMDAATENCGSINNRMIPVEQWLQYWNTAKNRNFLDKVFGESLILKRSYKWHEDPDTVENFMYDNICRSSDFIAFKYAIVEMLKEDERNNDFLTGYRSIINHDLMSASALANNSYKGSKFTLYLPNDKTFVLSPGSKIMKDLGVLAKYTDQADVFERIRIAHSQILNETSFNCNLCLSIHPLDYITASYNENDWRSCMCWADGDYCRGVIEMMNSSCVIVAYIESNHEEIRFNSKNRWNSKKWREFFIVDRNVISGIKGYPYWNRTIEEYCLNWLRELFNPYNPYDSHMVIFNGDFKVKPGQRANINFVCGPAMYNDFGHSDYRMYPSISFLQSDEDYIYYELNYSGPGECIVCGDIYAEFEETSDLCCLDCIDKIRCSHCGNLITGEIYELNGNYYCYDCFEGFNTCRCCGTVMPSADDDDTEKTIYFISDELFKDKQTIHYQDDLMHIVSADIEDEKYICKNCLKDKIKLYPDLIVAAKYSIEEGWWWSNTLNVYAAPISIMSQIFE